MTRKCGISRNAVQRHVVDLEDASVMKPTDTGEERGCNTIHAAAFTPAKRP